jgi:hypothetical protein
VAETEAQVNDRWVWGLYLFVVVWGLGLCFLLQGLLAKDQRRLFLEGRRTLLEHYALVFSDGVAVSASVSNHSRLQTYVDRLAAEPGARYAILTDRRGVRRVSAGEGLPVPWEERLCREALRAGGFRAWMVPVEPPVLDLSHVVWVRGKKWGVIRWGVWPDAVSDDNGGRLWAAWAWMAGAGAVLLSFRKRLAKR